MIDCGNRVLPDEHFSRDLRTKISRTRPHIAVSQLEPRPGERIRKLVRMFIEAP